MFRALHKVGVLCCWLAMLVLIGVLYQHRSLFYPVVDLVDALRVREGLEQKKSGEISGRVTRVLNGDMFILKDGHGRFHTIRLTGVEAPDYQRTNPSERSRADASRANLSRLVLSNEVRVELTFTNETRGALGIVYLGRTNVNLLAVETGMARARRDYMNGLPLKDRYALIHADRKAGERRAAPGD